MVVFADVLIGDTIFFHKDHIFYSGVVLEKKESASSKIFVINATPFGNTFVDMVSVVDSAAFADAASCIDDLEAIFTSFQTAADELIVDLRANF